MTMFFEYFEISVITEFIPPGSHHFFQQQRGKKFVKKTMELESKIYENSNETQ